MSGESVDLIHRSSSTLLGDEWRRMAHCFQVENLNLNFRNLNSNWPNSSGSTAVVDERSATPPAQASVAQILSAIQRIVFNRTHCIGYGAPCSPGQQSARWTVLRSPSIGPPFAWQPIGSLLVRSLLVRSLKKRSAS